MKKPIIFLFAFLPAVISAQITANLNVDFAAKQTDESHYWRCTGFTPGIALVRSDMQLTLEYLGTTAGMGIQYVRPHYLLNFIGTRGLGTAHPEYNWEKLDGAMDQLVNNQLKPVFEIMGHPSLNWEVSKQVMDAEIQAQKSAENRYFNDFENPEQMHQFRELVKNLAIHFIDRYGRDEVRTWYFETSNEPNLKNYWPLDLQDFLNYYDACSEGLKDADPALRFGGPATAGAPGNEYFTGLLSHCNSGTNYFTGKKGVRIDFISYHLKNRVRYMISQEKNVYDLIMKDYPGLMNVPLVNDEADPIAGWNTKYWWRPGPWYASFIVQSIDQHDRLLIDKNHLNYGFMSNDNGFMGDWFTRSHFARFTMDNDNQLSDYPGFYLVKKPVYTVMSLMSLLGDKRFPVKVDNQDKNFGIIPTTDSLGNYVIAVYNSPTIEISYGKPASTKMEFVDETTFQSQETNLKINIRGVTSGEYTLIHYRLDDTHGNPFAEWLKAGSPSLPSRDQYLKMISLQEPGLMGAPSDLHVGSNVLEFELNMPSPSVSILILARKTEKLPSPPSNLTSHEYQGLNNDRMLFIKWDDTSNSNILSYELMYKSGNDTTFSKLNAQYLRDRGFMHLIPESVTNAEYRVKAVDYWGRESELSEPLKINF